MVMVEQAIIKKNWKFKDIVVVQDKCSMGGGGVKFQIQNNCALCNVKLNSRE